MVLTDFHLSGHGHGAIGTSRAIQNAGGFTEQAAQLRPNALLAVAH